MVNNVRDIASRPLLCAQLVKCSQFPFTGLLRRLAPLLTPLDPPSIPFRLAYVIRSSGVWCKLVDYRLDSFSFDVPYRTTLT